MRFLISIFSLVVTIFVTSCAPGTILSQWDNPEGAVILITRDYGGKVFKGSLPSIIELEAYTSDYFVEILTKDGQKIYGTLSIGPTTKLTELSNVRIEITDELLEKVESNKVSQIVVNDPTERTRIVTFNMGNRMPEKMQDVYSDYGIIGLD